MSTNSGQTTQTGLNGYPTIVNGDIIVNTAAELAAALGYARYTVGPLSPSSISGLAMLGLAGAITPNATGNIVVMLSGNVSNDTGFLTTLNLRYGTGAAPSNGGAAAGTPVGSPMRWQDTSGSSISAPITAIAYISGLTLGTTYWIDASLNSAAGNNTMVGATIIAYEL